MQEVARWNDAQQSTLRRCALTLLFRVAPLFHDEFQELDGAGVLLQFVRHAENLQQIESALRVLRQFVQTHSHLSAWVGSRHAISIARGRFADASMPQELRQEAIVTLHALCADCAENLARAEAEGVVVAVAQETQRHRDAEPLLPNYFVIEMVSFIWTVVLASASALKAFLLAGGAHYVACRMPRWTRMHGFMRGAAQWGAPARARTNTQCMQAWTRCWTIWSAAMRRCSRSCCPSWRTSYSRVVSRTSASRTGCRSAASGAACRCCCTCGARRRPTGRCARTACSPTPRSPWLARASAACGCPSGRCAARMVP